MCNDKSLPEAWIRWGCVFEREDPSAGWFYRVVTCWVMADYGESWRVMADCGDVRVEAELSYGGPRWSPGNDRL